MTEIRIKWSKRPAKLVQKGEQCSEIKWIHNGVTQAISNEQIDFEGSDGLDRGKNKRTRRVAQS